MKRATPFLNKPSEEYLRSKCKLSNTTLLLVDRLGPTVFTLTSSNSNNSSSNNRNNSFKVLLGNPHTCSCHRNVDHNTSCIHILYCLLKVLRLPDDFNLSWQTSLTDNEIQQILNQSKISRPTINRSSPSFQTEKLDDASTTVCDSPFSTRQIVIEDGNANICPVCQDEMSQSSQPLTWCRLGCGNNFHAKCMQALLKHKMETKSSTSHHRRNPKPASSAMIMCPLCRDPWEMSYLKQDLKKPLSSLPAGIQTLSNLPCTRIKCSVCLNALINGSNFYRCIECSISNKSSKIKPPPRKSIQSNQSTPDSSTRMITMDDVLNINGGIVHQRLSTVSSVYPKIKQQQQQAELDDDEEANNQSSLSLSSLTKGSNNHVKNNRIVVCDVCSHCFVSRLLVSSQRHRSHHFLQSTAATATASTAISRLSALASHIPAAITAAPVVSEMDWNPVANPLTFIPPSPLSSSSSSSSLMSRSSRTGNNNESLSKLLSELQHREISSNDYTVLLTLDDSHQQRSSQQQQQMALEDVELSDHLINSLPQVRSYHNSYITNSKVYNAVDDNAINECDDRSISNRQRSLVTGCWCMRRKRNTSNNINKEGNSFINVSNNNSNNSCDNNTERHDAISTNELDQSSSSWLPYDAFDETFDDTIDPSSTSSQAAVMDETVICSRLPCGHVVHTHCLKRVLEGIIENVGDWYIGVGLCCPHVDVSICNNSNNSNCNNTNGHSINNLNNHNKGINNNNINSSNSNHTSNNAKHNNISINHGNSINTNGSEDALQSSSSSSFSIIQTIECKGRVFACLSRHTVKPSSSSSVTAIDLPPKVVTPISTNTNNNSSNSCNNACNSSSNASNNNSNNNASNNSNNNDTSLPHRRYHIANNNNNDNTFTEDNNSHDNNHNHNHSNIIFTDLLTSIRIDTTQQQKFVHNNDNNNTNNNRDLLINSSNKNCMNQKPSSPSSFYSSEQGKGGSAAVLSNVLRHRPPRYHATSNLQTNNHSMSEAVISIVGLSSLSSSSSSPLSLSRSNSVISPVSASATATATTIATNNNSVSIKPRRHDIREHCNKSTTAPSSSSSSSSSPMNVYEHYNSTSSSSSSPLSIASSSSTSSLNTSCRHKLIANMEQSLVATSIRNNNNNYNKSNLQTQLPTYVSSSSSSSSSLSPLGIDNIVHDGRARIVPDLRHGITIATTNLKRSSSSSLLSSSSAAAATATRVVKPVLFKGRATKNDSAQSSGTLTIMPSTFTLSTPSYSIIANDH